MHYSRYIITTLLIFQIVTTLGCSSDKSRIKAKKEAHQEVYNYIHKEFPSLEDKYVKLIRERENAKKNIENLKNLRSEHPNSTPLINTNINKWNDLLNIINGATSEIYDKSEEIFVLSVINRQKSGSSFSNISNRLLKKADQALEDARTIRITIIEETKHD